MTESQMGADLVAALADLQDPVKDGAATVITKGGQRFNYTFLTLSQLLNTARTTLGAHNLAVMQWPERTEDGIQVHTTLIHTSGQRMDFAPLGIRCTPDAQSVGSATSYARRYALAAILGLAGADDDDGHHATQVTRHQQSAGDPDEYRRQQLTSERDITLHDAEAARDQWMTGGGMAPFTADMPASQKQQGAIHAIMASLAVAQPKHAEFLLWLLRRDSPDRGEGIMLTKGDASHVIEQLQGDAGKALAQEYLGAML